MAFPLTGILDTFSGSLSNWINSQFGDNDLTISGGGVTGPSGVLWGGGAWYWGFSADMEAYATMAAVPGSGEVMSIWARCQNTDTVTGGLTGYGLFFTGPAAGSWSLVRCVNNDTSDVVTSGSLTASAGDSFGISVVGSTITAYYKATGSNTWSVLGSGTRTDITGAGRIGLEVQNNTGKWDNFGGGSLNAPPAPGAYDAAVLADSPVFYFPCDDQGRDLLDQSGHRYLATYVTYANQAVYGQVGPITSQSPNNAVYFNNLPTVFRIVQNASLGVADVFTTEGWIRRRRTGVFEECMINMNTNAPFMSIKNDLLHLSLAGVGDCVDSTVSITDTTKWHHCAITKNAGTVKVYLDSVDVTGSVTPRTFSSSLNDASLGGDLGVPSFVAQADLACLALYPTALSAARVLAHYQAATSSIRSDTPFVPAGRGASW